ncbi:MULTISPECIES: hypothetical protein [unclassified Streptomyces]|uniref:hypothetical protein n=1 Tax=unclassified Streptomyces TaxID=2593676 RepID=UPI002254FA18|nr:MULTISPECIES: hypothetical protein [unclassified Streptomyces]WSP57882.1 hypothetical protein OG306_28540 [Streptomyces sp. NBC_01241]WSU21380.1 hypothetical protein OG508_10570 [Streptomyces sp. NBC_01108]WTE36606.1 hypothetical protein OH735_27885 [Streptomyces sp. NBC_01618]MCX4789798.1 hypothetical protein [Streptomyces sp. NBC_01221]MCX4794500.1 hypothetical protein [Streptomyces sp. NBC_01242]
MVAGGVAGGACCSRCSRWGTDLGIRAIMATGEHGEREAALRHVRRHFITVDNL